MQKAKLNVEIIYCSLDDEKKKKKKYQRFETNARNAKNKILAGAL